MTTRLFFAVHLAADRVTGWWESTSSVLRWVTTSWGDQRIARGTSAPVVEGRRATTREGHAGAFATEAKEGGAGRAAGVGAGAVGGWAWGLGVGWAEGFLAAAALGGGPEPLTLAASSLTWPASEAKAASKEVQKSQSSSWGREGAVRGAEEGGLGERPSISRVETSPNPGSGLASNERTLGRSTKGSHPCSSHCST